MFEETNIGVLTDNKTLRKGLVCIQCLSFIRKLMRFFFFFFDQPTDKLQFLLYCLGIKFAGIVT